MEPESHPSRGPPREAGASSSLPWIAAGASPQVLASLAASLVKKSSSLIESRRPDALAGMSIVEQAGARTAARGERCRDISLESTILISPNPSMLLMRAREREGGRGCACDVSAEERRRKKSRKHRLPGDESGGLRERERRGERERERDNGSVVLE